VYRVPAKTNLPDYYTRTSADPDSAIEIVKRQGYAVLPDRTPVVRRRPPF
jgi:hypothetical protein